MSPPAHSPLLLVGPFTMASRPLAATLVMARDQPRGQPGATGRCPVEAGPRDAWGPGPDQGADYLADAAPVPPRRPRAAPRGVGGPGRHQRHRRELGAGQPG